MGRRTRQCHLTRLESAHVLLSWLPSPPKAFDEGGFLLQWAVRCQKSPLVEGETPALDTCSTRGCS